MSWSEIKKAINSDLNKPLDTLIKELLNNGETGLAALKVLLDDAAKETSIDEIEGLLKNSTYGLNALLNAMSSGGGGIKSVQMGQISTNSYDGVDSSFLGGDGCPSRYKDIIISSINMTKSFLLITGTHRYSVGEYHRQSTGKIINNTTIRVYSTYNSTMGDQYFDAHWQVVEFN